MVTILVLVLVALLLVVPLVVVLRRSSSGTPSRGAGPGAVPLHRSQVEQGGA